jgi:rhodanese-related sulfurtransferase
MDFYHENLTTADKKSKDPCSPADFLSAGIFGILGYSIKDRSICKLKSRFLLDAGTLFAAGRRGVMICLAGAVIGVLFNAVSPRGIDLLGPVPHREVKGIGELGLEEAWDLHKERTGVFVDARSAEEFGAGHIPGALLLPLDDFDEAVSSWTDLIPLETLLITYCDGAGCDSSLDVAELLKEEGYSQVKVFFGGWEKWKGAGYPVEKEGQTGKEPEGVSQLQSNREISRPEGG